MKTLDPIQRSKSALMVWLILTACCALFLILPFLAAPPLAPPASPEMLERLRIILTGLAVMMAGSSLFLRFYVLSGARMRKFVEGLKSTAGGPPTEEIKVARLLNYWFIFHLVAWGLNESIASLGLMVANTLREPSGVWPFAFAALILNGLMYPNFSKSARSAGLHW